MTDDRGPSDEDPLRRFLHADSGPLLFVREVLSSALAVALVGLLLFAVAGVWPPMVAVESESMEPHMHPGDLVFMTEPDRFSPSYAVGETGVVTAEIGENREYRSFNGYGSVVIYQTPERTATGQSPIIHRAMFYVEEGENWYDEANPEYVNGDSCEAIRYCPAPHAGFITKGDNNAKYDQALDFAGPVRSDWIRGIAQVRIPYLGWVRLAFSGTTTPAQLGPVDTAEAVSQRATVSQQAAVAHRTADPPGTTAADRSDVSHTLSPGGPTAVPA